MKSVRREFSSQKITEIKSTKKFDVVIIDDVFPYIDDVFSALGAIRQLCKNEGKLIMTSPPKITITNSLVGLFKTKNKKVKNWIPKQLLDTLLYLSDFWPRPLVDSCIIADAIEQKKSIKRSYSIIIPSYNEEGNIENCIQRIPDLHRDYEIIVVNDVGRDRTGID